MAQSGRDQTLMPERINKLQPDRTLYLRGFDTFAAAASIHNASPTGFTVSGTFRDPADFAVAVLYDADNYFEHPSIKYLPDFNFAGLTLSFRLELFRRRAAHRFAQIQLDRLGHARLRPLADGSSASIPLFDHAILVDAAFPAASGSLQSHLHQQRAAVRSHHALVSQNLPSITSFPDNPVSAQFTFFAGTVGAPTRSLSTEPPIPIPKSPAITAPRLLPHS